MCAIDDITFLSLVFMFLTDIVSISLIFMFLTNIVSISLIFMFSVKLCDMYRFVFMLLWVYYMCLLVFLLLWVYFHGRIQDLWLGGAVSRRGVWGPASPAGPRQSPGRWPRGRKPPGSSGGLRNYRHLFERQF
jgi:hypothetical protein